MPFFWYNGNETSYSYTSDGKLTGLTDSIGQYQRVTYDSDGNVSSTTNGAGESASYTYDKDGRVTGVTISREENGETKTFTSRYSYNAAGDITESIDNAGNVTTYEYDDNGNQTASVDANGRHSVLDLMMAVVKGAVVGFMVNKMCATPLGIILKPMMALFGLAGQVDQIEEAIKSGDTLEIAVRIVQLVCMLFALTSQCFTGDTLVSTADGLCPIEEIAAGDYVWSENTETGETELKKVLSVSVTETSILVHVFIEDENNTNTEISTTENHPFYVEGKGWVSASELQRGDILHTQDGRTETVSDIETEQLEEAVRVYNLEIEDSHTYYVSVDGVLVHNECHTATYEHLDDNGEVISSGTVNSGGTNPGRRLTWTEQLKTHTEIKILDILRDIVQEGDTIVITGTKPPCNPGRSTKPIRGCQGAMQEFAIELCVNILYFLEGDDNPWIFPQ